MTTLEYDFDGANGTLPSGWSDLSGGSSDASIQSNELRLTSVPSSSAVAVLDCGLGLGSVIDEWWVEGTFEVVANTFSYFEVILLSDATGAESFGLAFLPNDDSVRLYYYADPTTTALDTDTMTGLGNGSIVRFKFHFQYAASGGQIDVYTWFDGDTEPGTPNLTYAGNTTLAAAETDLLGAFAYTSSGTVEHDIQRYYVSDTGFSGAASAPAAITDLAGTAGDTEVDLTWTAPDDGGSAITDYSVEYRVTGETASAYGTSTSENGTSLGSNNAQPLPASAAAGDLIIGIIGHDNAGTTSISVSTGWTPLSPITQGANVVKGLIAARVLDGTTGNNILSVSGATQDYVVQMIRVPSGQHGCTNADLATSLAIANAQGASGSINPASLNTGSAKDRVWFVAGILDCTTGSTISAVPANYTSVLDVVSANTTSSVRVHTARRSLTATQTEDPGTFTNTSRNWIAYTIAVPPYTAPWQSFSDGTSSSTGATVTGLTNGTGYDFRVAAVNAIGTGPWSNIAGPYTPAAAGGPPLVGHLGTLSVAGGGTLRVMTAAGAVAVYP